MATEVETTVEVMVAAVAATNSGNVKPEVQVQQILFIQVMSYRKYKYKMHITDNLFRSCHIGITSTTQTTYSGHAIPE